MALNTATDDQLLTPRRAVVVFLVFALAYFFSALIRAITATLSPVLVQELALNASDLGLLAGGYFLGFSAMQLPLGTWLDRHGPKKVILGFLSIAVLGCVAFAMATQFAGLLAARILCGVGVCACLMAPLTGFRRWLSPTALLRANSWMLMTGSLGMLASTLPVAWLLPVFGWRPLFWGLAALVLLTMALLAWQAPASPRAVAVTASGTSEAGYAAVFRHPYFRAMVPVGFFSYGGLVAVQTLWAGPWLSRVAGRSAEGAAEGLFWINLCMLFTFWAWGWAAPRLYARGFSAARLMQWGLPFSYALLAIILIASFARPDWFNAAAVVLFCLYCMACSVVALAQPAVGMAFPGALAGRALSAFNLVIFIGVFVVQSGIGLMIDALRGIGWAERAAFQGATAVFLLCSVVSFLHFVWARADNRLS